MSSETLGSSAFREWMRERQSKYSIFAVEAPVEKAVGELTKLFKVEEWQKNVDRTGTLAELQGVPIVKLKGSPWTIVYWNLQRSLNINRDCRQISQKIDGKTIQLWEADTSGWGEWLVWQDGDEQEGAERMYDDDSVYFRSSLRKSQNFDHLDAITLKQTLDSLLDELLTKQEIHIPAPNLDLSDADIERVDLLVLPPTLGMWDFQSQMYEGHPEYAIFAVKAPIAQVSEAIANYCSVSDWKKDIREKIAIWDVIREEDRYWMPVIQPKSNDWTVVYWRVGSWQDLSQLCQELSSSMDTQVMELSEEDTSGAIGYSLYKQGKQLEFAEWCEELRFESELRDEPELDDFDMNEGEAVYRFINDRFIEEGIYIPTWDLETADEWLEQVDLIPR